MAVGRIKLMVVCLVLAKLTTANEAALKEVSLFENLEEMVGQLPPVKVDDKTGLSSKASHTAGQSMVPTDPLKPTDDKPIEEAPPINRKGLNQAVPPKPKEPTSSKDQKGPTSENRTKAGRSRLKEEKQKRIERRRQEAMTIRKAKRLARKTGRADPKDIRDIDTANKLLQQLSNKAQPSKPSLGLSDDKSIQKAQQINRNALVKTDPEPTKAVSPKPKEPTKSVEGQPVLKTENRSKKRPRRLRKQKRIDQRRQEAMTIRKAKRLARKTGHADPKDITDIHTANRVLDKLSKSAQPSTTRFGRLAGTAKRPNFVVRRMQRRMKIRRKKLPRRRQDIKARRKAKKVARKGVLKDIESSQDILKQIGLSTGPAMSVQEILQSFDKSLDTTTGKAIPDDHSTQQDIKARRKAKKVQRKGALKDIESSQDILKQLGFSTGPVMSVQEILQSFDKSLGTTTGKAIPDGHSTQQITDDKNKEKAIKPLLKPVVVGKTKSKTGDKCNISPLSKKSGDGKPMSSREIFRRMSACLESDKNLAQKRKVNRKFKARRRRPVNVVRRLKVRKRIGNRNKKRLPQLRRYGKGKRKSTIRSEAMKRILLRNLGRRRGVRRKFRLTPSQKGSKASKSLSSQTKKHYARLRAQAGTKSNPARKNASIGLLGKKKWKTPLTSKKASAPLSNRRRIRLLRTKGPRSRYVQRRRKVPGTPAMRRRIVSVVKKPRVWGKKRLVRVRCSLPCKRRRRLRILKTKKQKQKPSPKAKERTKKP